MSFKTIPGAVPTRPERPMAQNVRLELKDTQAVIADASLPDQKDGFLHA
jgi:hypothetical protein